MMYIHYIAQNVPQYGYNTVAVTSMLQELFITVELLLP